MRSYGDERLPEKRPVIKGDLTWVSHISKLDPSLPDELKLAILERVKESWELGIYDKACVVGTDWDPACKIVKDVVPEEYGSDVSSPGYTSIEIYDQGILVFKCSGFRSIPDVFISGPWVKLLCTKHEQALKLEKKRHKEQAKLEAAQQAKKLEDIKKRYGL